MSNAQTLMSMSPEVLKVVERANQRMRKDAAMGVDGVTKEEYGQALEANLQDLHARMKAKRHRHQPIRRVYIRSRTRLHGVVARRVYAARARKGKRVRRASKDESHGSQSLRLLPP